MNIVWGALVGIGGCWLPWGCLRLMNRLQLSRTRGVLYASTVASIFVSLFAAAIVTDFLVAVAAFAVAVIALVLRPRLRRQADFVVAAPLLGDAVSPELAVELNKLEIAAREQRLDEVQPDSAVGPHVSDDQVDDPFLR
jgi:hypothetical protein